MPEKQSLIFVGAHPDDESFGPGGTLARYAAAGAKVYYACATRGEVGEASAEHLTGFASTGDMRWSEMVCAGKALGLTDVIHLGYRDSGMPGSPNNRAAGALAAAPLDEVTGRVVKVLRELRPQVVVTFDPIGGYRHPDHIAIHQATVKAFHAAGDSAQFPEAGPAYRPQKLYYVVFSQMLLRLGARLMPLVGRDPRKFGTNHDIDLVDLTKVRFPIHAVVKIDSQARNAKRAASACHRSQLAGGPQEGGLFALAARLTEGQDSFMRAYPEPKPRERREKDLFEGVTGI
jgi:N-acetyl-1-D-myo-inositol-2-amino-2-deoxy-alpha-D-glucopyranoside deacetylase/mycothiol S-conjugate amidase